MNLKAFDMMTGTNESKSLIKYVSCDCRYRINDETVIQIKNGIKVNVDVSAKHHWDNM